jgi:hypothetical protein
MLPLYLSDHECHNRGVSAAPGPMRPAVADFMLTPETIPADKEEQTGGPGCLEHSAE